MGNGKRDAAELAATVDAGIRKGLDLVDAFAEERGGGGEHPLLVGVHVRPRNARRQPHRHRPNR